MRKKYNKEMTFKQPTGASVKLTSATAVSVLLLDFLRPPRSIDRRRRNVSRRTAANNDFLLRGMMCAIKVCIHKEGRKEGDGGPDGDGLRARARETGQELNFKRGGGKGVRSELEPG